MLSRVCVISYHSSPLHEPGSRDAGGMTVYVRSLAAALSDLGVRTDIYTRATGDTPVTVLGPGIRVLPVQAGPKREVPKAEAAGYLDDFETGMRAMVTAQRLRYDVVHSHYWQSGLVGRGLARAWGAPHVHSQHTLARVKNQSLAPGEEPEPVTRLAGEQEVISAADVLLASTDEEWQQLSCLYGAPHDRLKVLHPGVDHGRFTPGDGSAARRELGLPADAGVLLYVGRIQPLKGVELAVEGVSRLVERSPRELVFVIVGGPSGPDGARELERLHARTRELGLEGVVRFEGPQSHDRLPLYYRAADSLVLCSRSESFGLAALEAHACGTPVVATAVGGLSHFVRDGASGYLLAERDPALLADRIELILNDPARRALFGAHAVASAERFSWERAAASALELYECLVNEGLPQLCTC